MNIRELVRESRGEMIELLSELIRQDTTNLPGNEHLGVKVITDFCDRYGMPYEIHWKEPKRENIIIRIGTGKPRIFAAGHIDVVPAGDPSKWTAPPFEPKIENGKMFGRGTTDNKGPLAAILIAAKALFKMKGEFKGTLIAAGVADEEKGSRFGTEYLMEKGLIDCEYAVIPDIGGNMTVVDIAEKGVLDIKLTASGRSAHGSTPELGDNAIYKMSDAVKKLREFTFEFEKHRFLSAPTMNMGLINGGSAPNMVPDKCEAVVNIRYLPGMNAEKIRSSLEAYLSEYGIRAEIISNIEPSEVDPECEIVKLISRMTKEATGIEPKLIGLGGATVCKTFIKKNIPAVGWGAGGDCAHMPDECIDLDNLMNFAEVFAAITYELIKK